MHFEQNLAPYAATSKDSLGRVHPEQTSLTRTEFQRDRERITHCTAFRRLEYKTQVFVNHEGDLFRTRLTHTLEVAQIGRAIGRQLRLDEDLIEAIALAHDLGHTPFGHAGQDALHACMKDNFGGFEHNLQSLRIVDVLEEKYAMFDGLNLTFETREGILKHCSVNNAKDLGAVGRRFLEGKQPSLEAQLTNIADAVAYNNHDVDDGLRSKLITEDQLMEVDVYARNRRLVEDKFPGIAGRRATNETIRGMINEFIIDLTNTSRANILAANPQSVHDVREMKPMIRFSDKMAADNAALKKFLRVNLYKHYKVKRMTLKAQRVVTELFTAFMEDPELLPPDYKVNAPNQARKIADYIAGMTDRFAFKEYNRVFQIAE